MSKDLIETTGTLIGNIGLLAMIGSIILIIDKRISMLQFALVLISSIIMQLMGLIIIARQDPRNAKYVLNGIQALSSRDPELIKAALKGEGIE